MPQKNESVSTTDREIVITRILNAPQALVFDVWTDAAHLDEWWGPNGFVTVTQSRDMKPGGTWSFIMHGPDGTDYPNRVRYTEIVKPERISYIHDTGKDNDPDGFEVTVTFEAMGDKTKLTLKTVFRSVERRNLVIEKYGAIEGGNQTISRFEAQLARANELAGDVQELVITREFNAPRALVFKALSEAEALAQWWGPKGMKVTDVTLDFRPSGKFHYCMKGDNGFEMWGLFNYREIVAPERIVFVNSFSDKDGNITPAPFFDGKWPLEVLNVLTLAEHDGKTTLTIKGRPINATEEGLRLYEQNTPSMHQGFGGTFDQLDEYLAKNNK